MRGVAVVCDVPGRRQLVFIARVPWHLSPVRLNAAETFLREISIVGKDKPSLFSTSLSYGYTRVCNRSLVTLLPHLHRDE